MSVLCSECPPGTTFDSVEARLAHRLETGHRSTQARFGTKIESDPSGRFETVANGFGGTTSRRVAGTRVLPQATPSQRRQPQFRRATSVTTRATQRQTDFLRKLLGERNGDPQAEVIRQRLNAWREQGGITKAAASKAIEDLIAIPKPVAHIPEAEVAPSIRVNRFGGRCESCTRFVGPEEGRLSKDDEGNWQVWHLDGECPETEFPFPYGSYALDSDEGVKFYVANDDGLFAQASDDLFPLRAKETRDAVIVAIAADPLEAAKRYGRELGECGRCHRKLTSEWRKEGIGPVCSKKRWS